MQSIEVPSGSPPTIRVSTRSGRVDVRALPGNTVTLETGGRIEIGGDGRVLVTPDSSSKRVGITCPEASDLIVGTSSGSVDLTGRLGAVHVTTGSGTVRLAEATKADLRVASGRAEVGRCERLRVQAGSGDVSVQSAGDVEISAASGRVHIEDARQVKVRAASARVDVCVRGDTAVQTISGKVRIAVAPGLSANVRCRSLSGKRRTECPEGNDLQVQVQTVSGDIEVVEA
jgi:DUF4097 and DUF4098 domain-containing protein YvlB